MAIERETTTKVVAIVFWLAAGVYSAVSYEIQRSAETSFLVGRAVGFLFFGFLVGYLLWRVMNRGTPKESRSQFSTVYFIAAVVIFVVATLPSR